MTEVIVEVGPETVRGPNDARPERVSVALEFIDDDIALPDERPVSVQDIWNEVMRAVAGAAVDTVVLVFPTWWSSTRIERVRAAARTVASTEVVLERTPLLRDGTCEQRTTIVELAAEFVVVTRPRARADVVPRRGGPAAVAEAVAAAIGASEAVLIDDPADVDGVEPLGASIAHRVRATGTAVRFTDEDSVRRAAVAWRERQQGQSDDDTDMGPRMDRRRRGTAVFAGVLSAVVLCGGFAVRGGTDSPDGDMPMTLLVEGRVGVLVPAVWTAQRITSGPGSARVQIVSPVDNDVALHLTQSTGAPRESLAVTADSLRMALENEPGGVFVDFNPSDRRADKPAVTYREVRPDHHVAWVVLIDDTVRIAIGCQSAPGREHLVRGVCDQAIRSAHAVF